MIPGPGWGLVGLVVAASVLLLAGAYLLGRSRPDVPRVTRGGPR